VCSCFGTVPRRKRGAHQQRLSEQLVIGRILIILIHASIGRYFYLQLTGGSGAGWQTVPTPYRQDYQQLDLVGVICQFLLA